GEVLLFSNKQARPCSAESLYQARTKPDPGRNFLARSRSLASSIPEHAANIEIRHRISRTNLAVSSRLICEAKPSGQGLRAQANFKCANFAQHGLKERSRVMLILNLSFADNRHSNGIEFGCAVYGRINQCLSESVVLG
ncbi:MAG: hypothetical protein ONB49_06260, partial [candidate division KSB1 bacterium]|nr:hypothetical protein [candidate division KSB1 bacterium]